MGLREEIKGDLEILSKKIDFVIIRNYEFLFSKSLGLERDLDLIIKSLSKREVLILEEIGYFQISKSRNKSSFCKVLSTKNELVNIFFLDFHIKNLTGNSISYKLGGRFLNNKIIKEGIPIPSKTDYLLGLIMRETLTEGFTKKYDLRIYSFYKEVDKKELLTYLKKFFGVRESKKLLNFVEGGDFNSLNRLRTSLKIRFVLKNLFSYIKTLFFMKKRKGKLVSIIGLDGTGKTTLVKECGELLFNYSLNTTKLYMGRGKKNVLPIKRIGDFVKPSIDKGSLIVQKIIYSSAAVLNTLDLLIRYFFIVFPIRKKYCYILTDRFTSDILLVKNVSKHLRRMLYAVMPKADLYIYLYDDLKVISKRRRGHNLEDLKRQEQEFVWVNKILRSVKIRNESLQISKKLIIKEILKI